ncbi:phage tail tape measure protein [Pseudomonas sp. ArH3a]|uniref:phage tail tape measure protein n=1 Tax=Pseudomonas sp. ArH3a TaxID=2862945 RepID=UPI001F569A9A|nr:phage tail tape measure protein [Pseudomonas sp. ArH3a]UNM18036.1 phage tail tape measure protein [Pseudomonas sp. ArH3a]
MASRSLGTLTLDLIARIGGFQQGMDRASRSVASTGAAADAASARIQALQGQFLSLSSITSKIAGPLAAAFSVNSVYQATEAYSSLTNRLKLVTSGSDELVKAQKAVFDIAQSSRQPLSATAELYQRIATNQSALKLSGEGVAGVVGTISKTLAISGASAESANAALIQLGQAFASGVLRGEELNSVMEQAPALSQAIAAGMGKTVGELRTMGAAGELTAKAVVSALQSQAGAVDTLFAKTATTIGNSFTAISNSMTRFVGELDQATGASSRVAAEFVGLSKAIDNGLPAAMSAVTKNSEALSQALTTGLYVALGRVAGGYAALIPATIAKSMATAQEAKASLAAASAATRKAEVDLVSAKNAVQVAMLNRRLAVTVTEVMIAENALSAAKAKALALTERLTVARGAEAAANVLVTSTSTAAGIAMGLATRAATALTAAGRGLLALMGGPVGLLFIAGAVALSFADFRSSSDKAREGLEQLRGPMDDVIARFKAMTEEQKAGAMVRWSEAQVEAVKAAKSELDTLQATLKKGVLGSDSLSLPARIAGSSSDQTIQRAKAYKELSDRIESAARSGQSLIPILEEAGKIPGVSPKLVDELKKRAEAWSTQDQVVKESVERQRVLSGEMGKTAAATATSTQAATGLTAAGEKYLKTLQGQVGALQDNNDAVKEASRYLDEHKDLSEADRVAIMSAAHAKKAAAEANKAATAEIKSNTSAIKTNLKTFEDAQENYKRQIALIDESSGKRKSATEVDKLAFEIASGNYAKLSDQRKSELSGLAAELDAKKALVKANEDAAKLSALKFNLSESNQSAKDGFDQELAGAGQGDEYRARLKEFLSIDQDFNKQRREMYKEYKEATLAGDPDAEENYNKETALLEEALAERIVIQQDYYNQLDEAQSNWMDGVSDAWQNYVDAATNYSAMAAEATTSVLDGAKSGLSTFLSDVASGAETAGDALGNLVADFAKSTLQALSDMAAQWLVYQAVQLVVGKTTQSTALAGMVGNAQAASFQAQLNAYASTAGIPLVGPALAPAAALAAAAATAPMVAGVASAAMVGMAHDGMGSIPKEGTWLLDGGERVVAPEQNKDLTNFLARQTAVTDSSGGGGGIHINAPVTVQAQPGMSGDDARKQGEAAGQGLVSEIRRVLQGEMGQGGLLWRRV